MKRTIVTAGTAFLAVLVTACATHGKSAQDRSQKLTNDYQQAAINAVPYPRAQVERGGFLERRLLVENLLRENNANRIAYVTLLNWQGQPIVQYTVQGRVFSLSSQLSNTENVSYHHGNAVTEAPGDNGTYGPEPDGVAFFDTSGVEHKWNGLYLESDAPDHITTKPLITYNVQATPSVSAGYIKAK